MPPEDCCDICEYPEVEGRARIRLGDGSTVELNLCEVHYEEWKGSEHNQVVQCHYTYAAIRAGHNHRPAARDDYSLGELRSNYCGDCGGNLGYCLCEVPRA